MGIWGELGIEATKDKELITKAYRDRLVKVNPEVDSQGFMKLRNAYEEAMKYADTIEEEDNTPIGKCVTSENYFQAYKFMGINMEYVKIIMNADSPMKAKML